MDLGINGKLALVSGSTAGIGLAIATALLGEGAKVIINGRSQAFFFSGESAVQIPTEMIHYGMTKTAQIAGGLAESVVGTGITVNSILPGPTKSRGLEEFVETLAAGSRASFEEFEKKFFEEVRPTSLIKRFATPQEVASLVAYIASPLSSATTGAALRVDSGVVKSLI